MLLSGLHVLYSRRARQRLSSPESGLHRQKGTAVDTEFKTILGLTSAGREFATSNAPSAMSASARPVAAALLALTGAFAAPAAADDDGSGLYVSLSGLYVFPTDSDWSETDVDGLSKGKIDLENSIGVLGAVGYGLSTNLRVEFEIGYRALDVDRVTVTVDDGNSANESHSSKGDIRTLSVMANGYYAFGDGRIMPYIGGGLGIARHKGNYEEEPGDWLRGKDTVFAYQAMAGVGYGLSETTELRLGYRYFATEDWDASDVDKLKASYRTHNIEAGVSVRF